MAKQPAQKASAADSVRNAARKGARFTWSTILWLVPIALLIIGIWLLFFRDTGPSASSGQTAASHIEAYTTLVRHYAPPSSLSPAQGTVAEWLDFFDKDSRDWFEANLDKLSFMQYQNRVDEWKEFTRGKKQMEAMRYVLSVGPLRGGSVRKMQHSEDDSTARVEVSTGSTTHQIPLAKVSDRWVFTDMMGQRPELERRIAPVTLPK